MIIDAHLHCSGREDIDGVLRTLDDAQVDVAVLLAPFLTDPYTLGQEKSLRSANAYLGKLIRGHGDRLIGFAVVNPLFADAAQDLARAVEDDGLRGVKLVPSGWKPYDPCAGEVYQAALDLHLPVLFHSGIFIDGRSGRFCRPAGFEVVRDFPGLRVTLAHLGWPWCDEAIAVGLIDLINGVLPDDSQFRFDLSFGAPPIYRLPALKRALEVLGPELLQFGSDRFLPCPGQALLDARHELEALLDQLEVDAATRERIFHGTAANWLGI